ncbi:fimbrial assembly protein [Paraburkholderia sp. Cy-641]|uniref:fimbrial assembly protein n=1 Tax=Paraburkholderia sp. Cy-641 TaxID=2608337 RepID=UPI001F036573|nr:fimbrial assembly protein [Paraburkholderia sp. Cy-641]
MMRGLSFVFLPFWPAARPSLPPTPPVASRETRFAKPWLGGFNLLPYRQRNARLARRRCLRDWAVAACVGAAGVLAFAGWQAVEKTRLEARRALAEQALAQLAAPLAEHAKLRRAQDEQRNDAARATSLSVPLAHLLDLLEVLSFEPGDGVVLRQLRQREYETELLATSRSHVASAEWLKRVGAVHGVQGAEMRDLHRPATRGGAATDKTVNKAANKTADTATDKTASGPVEFDARLRWGEPPPKNTLLAGASAAHGAKSAKSGGEK